MALTDINSETVWPNRPLPGIQKGVSLGVYTISGGWFAKPSTRNGMQSRIEPLVRVEVTP